MSLPAWERGLKPDRSLDPPLLLFVAPRVGAWIETCRYSPLARGINVAPRVGAWIETSWTA